jgi:sugar lactone lactonase YvrE
MRPRGVAVFAGLVIAAGCGGNGAPESASGPAPGGAATRAVLADPEALAVDSTGNLYVSEFSGARVDRIAPAGTLTVIAGTGSSGLSGDGGRAVQAQLDAPTGLIVETDGRLLIADHHNNRVRAVDRAGVITTVKGSIAAGLHDPIGIALDKGALYVADELNARVLRIERTGKVTIVAGGGSDTPGDGGPATRARLLHPSYLLIDRNGDLIFSDFMDNRIRRVDRNGVITTIADRAELNFPTGLALDSSGNLYVSDANNNRVRRIDRNGQITTVAGDGAKGFSGDGGPATKASLDAPAGLALDAAGNLYIADQGNNRVRRVDTHGVITTVAGR